MYTVQVLIQEYLPRPLSLMKEHCTLKEYQCGCRNDESDTETISKGSVLCEHLNKVSDPRTSTYPQLGIHYVPDVSVIVENIVNNFENIQCILLLSFIKHAPKLFAHSMS